jgi:drug/metabolite transporter (DMT)-like permease
LVFPVQQSVTPGVALAVLALGVLCTGVAYLLYFKLVQEVGATSTLTVTFLIPVFGVLWGWLFLQEQVGWHTLGGSLTVLMGTALVTGFQPAALWQQHRTK